MDLWVVAVMAIASMAVPMAVSISVAIAIAISTVPPCKSMSIRRAGLPGVSGAHSDHVVGLPDVKT
eukprot:6209981-Amphidinium_carterae.1